MAEAVHLFLLHEMMNDLSHKKYMTNNFQQFCPPAPMIPAQSNSPRTGCMRRTQLHLTAVASSSVMELVLINSFSLNFLFSIVKLLPQHCEICYNFYEIKPNWLHICVLHLPANPFWWSPTFIQSKLAVGDQSPLNRLLGLEVWRRKEGMDRWGWWSTGAWRRSIGSSGLGSWGWQRMEEGYGSRGVYPPWLNGSRFRLLGWNRIVKNGVKNRMLPDENEILAKRMKYAKLFSIPFPFLGISFSLVFLHPFLSKNSKTNQ